ncbi:Hypothetical predicted protein [Pelobates cultripes]|uniref:Uncharacterized protein n=1 Tax=Pelobates cultripes TaxID=61616 RepID=A0AAD1WMI5_PELCU|nr:Hypothetical predicted protein [Pelobates cultripes]
MKRQVGLPSKGNRYRIRRDSTRSKGNIVTNMRYIKAEVSEIGETESRDVSRSKEIERWNTLRAGRGQSGNIVTEYEETSRTKEIERWNTNILKMQAGNIVTEYEETSRGQREI